MAIAQKTNSGSSSVSETVSTVTVLFAPVALAAVLALVFDAVAEAAVAVLVTLVSIGAVVALVLLAVVPGDSCTVTVRCAAVTSVSSWLGKCES